MVHRLQSPLHDFSCAFSCRPLEAEVGLPQGLTLPAAAVKIGLTSLGFCPPLNLEEHFVPVNTAADGQFDVSNSRLLSDVP